LAAPEGPPRPWILDERNPKFGKGVAHILEHMRQTRGDYRQAVLGERPADLDDVIQFLAFAAPLAPHSKSQLFQELWALWRAGGKRDGYFVEFGASSGVKLSNTWFLETGMGWNGILAEPHPVHVEHVRAARRCHVSDLCVYSRSNETMTFRMVAESDHLSRLADIDPMDGHEADGRQAFEETTVRTISLNDLLTRYDAPREIDYLSIDTEGSELEILRSFDFDRWRVNAVTVEHNYTAAEQALDALFFANGYRRVWPQVSRFDAWYVKA
jgi:FkbM family methyltransferase